MENYIKSDLYLQRLIDRRENGEVKIITGDDIAPYINDNGITYISLFHFLKSDRVVVTVRTP